MLNNISWISYLIFISLILSGYYVVVVFYYYKAELLQIAMRGKGKPMSGEEKKISEAIGDSDPDLFPVAHLLMEKLKRLLEQTRINDEPKEELRLQLRKELSKDHGLKATAFQAAINNFLREEAKTQCAVLLSAEDLRFIWDG